MSSTKDQELKKKRRLRRRRSIRNTIYGTAERPRLTVFRSSKNISCQIIDDQLGRTLVAVSTLSSDVGLSGYPGNCAAASIIGRKIAEKALALGIDKVQFDRNGYRFHGRVKALADAAREGGLKF